MDPEVQAPLPEAVPAEPAAASPARSEPVFVPPDPWETRLVQWIFLNGRSLRCGWSAASFMLLFFVFLVPVGAVAAVLYPAVLNRKGDLSPMTGFVGEMLQFLPVLGAAFVMALIERRRILDYNLSGPRRLGHFVSGLAVGFAALSVMVGALVAGGWMHFGTMALSGAAILKFGAVWACVFILVGFTEEGMFRCYLQFTLTRGINFWWALGVIGAACADLILRSRGNGAWGVYIIALLGLVPCLAMQLKKAQGARFWQAAWVTSTLFGFIHTSNNGENWVGIFSAAFIGFVFCVSIRVTGSAWWAIGCHASWDWAQSYFYGTPDSGMVARGHLLTAIPAGSALWSGGADGPEGSALILPILLLILGALLLVHGRRKPTEPAVSDTGQGGA